MILILLDVQIYFLYSQLHLSFYALLFTNARMLKYHFSRGLLAWVDLKYCQPLLYVNVLLLSFANARLIELCAYVLTESKKYI